MKLGERLESIISLLKPVDTIADVGLDHGFLSIELIERQMCKHVIGTDLNAGPLENARKNVKRSGLETQITLIQSNGLQALKIGDSNAAIIAGMGGELIINIIENSLDVARSLSYLIIQPQSVQNEVREWIEVNGFSIEDEALSEENGKFYEAIRISNGNWKSPSKNAYETGIYLNKNPELYEKFINQKIKTNQFALKQLENSKSERGAIQKKVIEERIKVLQEAIQ